MNLSYPLSLQVSPMSFSNNFFRSKNRRKHFLSSTTRLQKPKFTVSCKLLFLACNALQGLWWSDVIIRSILTSMKRCKITLICGDPREMSVKRLKITIEISVVRQSDEFCQSCARWYKHQLFPLFLYNINHFDQANFYVEVANRKMNCQSTEVTVSLI